MKIRMKLGTRSARKPVESVNHILFLEKVFLTDGRGVCGIKMYNSSLGNFFLMLTLELSFSNLQFDGV